MTTEIDFQVDPIVRETENRRLAWDCFQFVAYNKPKPPKPDTYVPREDSVAARTIQYLKTLREGAQVSKKDIATALDVKLNTLDSCLWRSEQAGLLVRNTREELYTSVLVWSLPVAKEAPHPAVKAHAADIQLLEEAAA